MVIDPQGRWLVTGSADKTARRRDLRAADPSQTARVLPHHRPRIMALPIDPQGRWLVTSSGDNTARLWDLQAAYPNQTARVLSGHEGGIRAVAIDPQGRWLVTGSQPRPPGWGFAGGQSQPDRPVLSGHEGGIYAVAIEPPGRWLVTTGSHDNTARLWDLQAADPNRPPHALSGHAGR